MEIELQLKATAALAEAIRKELELEDEDTKGLFRDGSDKSDTRDRETSGS